MTDYQRFGVEEPKYNWLELGCAYLMIACAIFWGLYGIYQLLVWAFAQLYLLAI